MRLATENETSVATDITAVSRCMVIVHYSISTLGRGKTLARELTFTSNNIEEKKSYYFKLLAIAIEKNRHERLSFPPFHHYHYIILIAIAVTI